MGEVISLKSVAAKERPEESAAEDFELVRNFKRDNDAASFETLFRRHQQYIANLCLSLLRSRAEAEDAVQEIFIKVYKGLHSFEPRVTFRGWLYRIAVNHCRDLLDQRKSRAENNDEAALEALMTAPSQEKVLVASMTIEAALAKLKPEYRMAFVLQAVEGYSIAEVAELLDIGFEAAASRLRRAHKNFIEAYDSLANVRNPKNVNQ
jgi:RNA polymerase sigma-70 factor (ECF subfamily)